jgi:hypothetical protein
MNTVFFNNYNAENIKRLAFRFLESMHIIENSNSPDTVYGRLQLMESMQKELENYKNQPRYLSDIQEGIDLFKSLHYEKIPSQMSLFILTSKDITNLDEVYCVNIFNSFGRQFKNHVSEYRSLKRKEAKISRKEKLLEVASNVKTIIERKSTYSKNAQNILNGLKAIVEIIETDETYDDVEF